MDSLKQLKINRKKSKSRGKCFSINSMKSDYSKKSIITIKTLLTNLKSTKSDSKRSINSFSSFFKRFTEKNNVLELKEKIHLHQRNKNLNDVSNFFYNFLKCWFYFFKIILSVSSRVYYKIYSTCINSLKFFIQIFLLFFYICFCVVPFIYFLLKYVFFKLTKFEYNFFFIKSFINTLRNDQTNKNQFFLFLNLNNSLFSLSKEKPSHNNFNEIEIENSNEKPKTIYIIKRNNLDEFLNEVN